MVKHLCNIKYIHHESVWIVWSWLWQLSTAFQVAGYDTAENYLPPEEFPRDKYRGICVLLWSLRKISRDFHPCVRLFMCCLFVCLSFVNCLLFEVCLILGVVLDPCVLFADFWSAVTTTELCGSRLVELRPSWASQRRPTWSSDQVTSDLTISDFISFVGSSLLFSLVVWICSHVI